MGAIENAKETIVRFIDGDSPGPGPVPPGPEPTPTPGGGGGSSWWTSQTGDTLSIVLFAIIAVAAVVMGIFFFKKWRESSSKYGVYTKPQGISAIASSVISSNAIAKICVFFITACLAVLMCTGISHAAENLVTSDLVVANASTSVDSQDIALNNVSNDFVVDATEVIQVKVYDDRIEIDNPSYLQNIGDTNTEFIGLSTSAITGDLSGVKWTIKDSETGDVLYDNEIGKTNIFNVSKDFAVGKKYNYTLSVDDNLTIEKAKALVDKDVFKISYTCGANILPEAPAYSSNGALAAAFEGKIDATLATKVSFIKDNIENYRSSHDIRYEADLSAYKTGNIMAFVVDDDTSNSYKIDIVSPNKILCSPNSMVRFFRSFRNLVDINFDNLDLSTNTDFTEMFSFAGRVDGIMTIKPKYSDETAGLIKTGPNTSFKEMFYNCNASVDLSNFDISNVACMDDMFKDFCYDVPKADLKRISIILGSESNPFAIPNGCSVYGMFARCNYDLNASQGDDDSVIEQIKLSKTKSCAGLFYNYRGLYRYSDTKEFVLDVSSLDPENIGKIEDMTDMFAYTFDGKTDSEIIFVKEGSETKFPAALNCSGMFKGCDSIKLDLTNVDFSKTNNMSYMFEGYGAVALFTVETSITWADNVKVADNCDLSYMYKDSCLKSNFLDKLATTEYGKISNMEGMYKGYGSKLLLDYHTYSLKVEFPSNFKVKDNCSLSKMFSYAKCNVDLSNFDTTNIVDFSYMFEAFGYVEGLGTYQSCYSIKYPSGGLKTAANASFAHMFDMVQLTEVDISALDTSKVNNLSGMFTDLGQVFEIGQQIVAPMSVKIKDNANDKRTFAANADMSYMFDGYRKLFAENKLDLSNWDLSTVQNFEGMFRGVNNTLNLDNIEFRTTASSYVNIVFPTSTTADAANMAYMFDHAFLVTSGDKDPDTESHIPGNLTFKFSGINTSKVVNMSHMFEYAMHKYAKVRSEDYIDYYKVCIDVSDMALDNASDMSFMFHYALPVWFEETYGTGLDGTLKLFGATKNPKVGCDAEFMFSGVGAVEIPMTELSAKNFGNMNFFFSSYGNINFPGKIDLSKFSIANASSVKGMFYNAYFNYAEGTDLEIDLTSWDTKDVTDMSYLFLGLKCNKLNISTWDFSNVETMEGMFMGFGFDPAWEYAESTIAFPKSWAPGSKKATTGCSMKLAFSLCLADVDLSGINVNYVNDMYGTFMAYGCSINQIIQILKELGPDKNASDLRILSSVLNGDASAADEIVNSVSNPVWNSFAQYAEGTASVADEATREASEQASSAQYLEAPETTDKYMNDDLEQVAFSKDRLADLVDELNFDELSSSHYTSELSGVLNNSYYEYTDDIKAELADVISHCELPDFNAILDLPEDYSSSQPNFATVVRTITFPTEAGSFAPAKSLTGQFCNMRMMFLLCNAFNVGIKEAAIEYPLPKFSGFDTSKVDDMSFMFTGYCFGFSYDISSVDFEKYDMDVSSFDTSNVKDMMMMFAFSGFNLYVQDKATGTEGHVYATDLKLGDKFKFKDGCDTRFMFTWCRTNKLDLSAMNTTGNLKSTRFMFSMGAANEVDLTGWDTSNVVDMSYMFSLYGVPAIFIDAVKSYTVSSSQITLSQWKPNIIFGDVNAETKKFVLGENTLTMGMFFCPYLENLDLRAVDVSKRKSINRLFEMTFCSLLKILHDETNSLSTLDISTWDTSSIVDYKMAFAGATFSNFNTPSDKDGKWKIASGADLSYMFFASTTYQYDKTKKYAGLDISSMELNNAGNMKSMFAFYAPFMSELDYKNSLIKFGEQTINCADLSHMFEFCGMGVDMSGVTVTAAKDLDRMFAMFGLGNRIQVIQEPATEWEESRTRVALQPNLTYYSARLLLPKEANKFITADGATADFMFAGSYVLNENDVPEYDNNYGTPGFIDLKFLNTTKIRRMEGMFMLSQTSFDLSTLNINNADSVKMMFMGYGLAKNFNGPKAKILDKDKKYKWAMLTLPKVSTNMKIKANCDVKFMFSLSYIPSDNTAESGKRYFDLTSLSCIDVSQVTNFDCMFALGAGAFNYDISSWDFSGANSLNFTFAGYGLIGKFGDVQSSGSIIKFNPQAFTESMKLPNFKPKDSVAYVNAVGTFLGATFYGYKSEKLEAGLDLSGWDFSKIAWAYGMFAAYNMHLTIEGIGVMAVRGASIKFPNDKEKKPFKFIQNADLTSLFAFANANINLDGFVPNGASSMNSMFAFFGNAPVSGREGVTHPWEITWPKEAKSLVIPEGSSVRQMFFGYQADNLDLTSLDIKNVTDMTRMFAVCDVAELDVDDFDTSNVVDMKEAFSLASAATLDLSKWDFSKVKDMRFMFAGYGSNTHFYGGHDYDCEIRFPLTGMATGENCDATAMFMAVNMRELPIYGFNVDNITRADYMFAFSEDLETINVKDGTDWYQNGSTLMSGDGMFYGCTKLKGQFDTKYSAAHISFTYARADLPDKPGYFTTAHMLRQYDEEDDISIFRKNESTGTGFDDADLAQVEQVNFKLGDLSKITGGIDLSTTQDKSILASLSSDKKTLDVVSAGSIYSDELSLKCMFKDVFKMLKTVNFDNLNVVEATTTKAMFEGCVSLTTLDVSKLQTTNVVEFAKMFKGVGANTAEGASISFYTEDNNFNSSCGFDYESMFEGAKIKDLDLSKFEICSSKFRKDIAKEYTMISMESMFEGYLGSSIIFPGKGKKFYPVLEYGKEYSYRNMFENCNNLNVLDISSFAALPNFSHTDAMFKNCQSLTTINVGDDFSKAKFNPVTSEDMFLGCSKLTGECGTIVDMVRKDYGDTRAYSAEFAVVDGSSEALLPEHYGYFSGNNVAKSDALRDILKRIADSGKNNNINDIQFLRGYSTNDYTYKQSLNGDDDKSIMVYLVNVDGDNNRVSDISEIADCNLSVVITSENTIKLRVIDSLFSYPTMWIKYINFENTSLLFEDKLQANRLFYGNSYLENVKFPDYDGIFEGLTLYNEMFVGCASLKTLDTSRWFLQREDGEKIDITEAWDMFGGCTQLTTIYCKPGEEWNVSDKNWGHVFTNCTSLQGTYGHKLSDFAQDGKFARDDKPGEGPDNLGLFTSGCTLADIDDSQGIQSLILRMVSEDEEHKLTADSIEFVQFTSSVEQWIREDCTFKISLSEKGTPDKNTVWAYVFKEGEGPAQIYICCDEQSPNKTIYCNKNSLRGLFYDFTRLTSIEMTTSPSCVLDTSGATNMSYMFSNVCRDNEYGNLYLESQFLRMCDTSNVTDFSHMFENANIYELDLYHSFSDEVTGTDHESLFDTSKATNLSHMFDNFGCDYGVSFSREIYPSTICLYDSDESVNHVFKAAPNCDASYMFYKCHVKKIDLRAWELKNVTNYDYMFARSGVYTLDIFGPEANSGDNVEVNTVKNIVSAIASEDNVALETAFTEAVESGTRVGRSKIFPGEIYFNNEVEWGSVLGPVSMEGMFMGCLFGEQGEEGSNYGIDLSNMRTDKATNMAEMFEFTPMFTEVKVSQHFGTDMCKNMYAMFKFCGSLNATGKFGYGDSFTFPELTFKKGCIVESMFQGANIPVDLSKAKSPDVPKEVSALNAIKDYTRMFCDYGFYALTEIIGGQPKNLKLTLTDKDHPWTPPVGSTMEEMFRGCKADVDLSNLDVTNVVSFGGTFMSYGNTDQLDLFGFEPGTITWPTKGWKTDSGHDVDMSCMFKGFKGKDNLNDLLNENFTTANVTNMGEMFRGAKVKKLDLSNFKTTKAIDMSYMFSTQLLRPSYVTEITLPDDFITENSVVRNISYMFGSAIVQNEYLRTINCNTDWNDVIAKLVEKKKVVFTEGLFTGCISLVGNIDKATQTVYDPDFVGLEFARPGYLDKDGKTLHRGYFTGTHEEIKAVEAVASESVNENTEATESESSTEEEVVEPSVEPEVKPVIDPLAEDEDVEIAIEGPLDNIDLVFADDYELDNMGTVATTFFQNIFNQLFKMILSLAL